MNNKKLTSVNFHNTGLVRVPYSNQFTHLSSVISNIRYKIVDLGFDCSLLNDSEILAFSYFIDDDDFIEILNSL